MGRAAIYALPARYEPFGLSILEAALSGCALVIGDIPSLREIWADAALFVPSDGHDAPLAHVGELHHALPLVMMAQDHHALAEGVLGLEGAAPDLIGRERGVLGERPEGGTGSGL